MAINENVTDDIKEMTTKDLLEESNKNISLFYVAAVVNASQYVPGYRMSYILGAGDNTTDPNGHVFYNREGVQGRFLVLYRVFSANSTAEVQYMYHNIIVLLYFNFVAFRMKYSPLLIVDQVSITDDLTHMIL